MATEGDTEQDEPARSGWCHQGRRSYLGDESGIGQPDPEAGEPESHVVDDPRRFDRLAVIDLEPEERKMLIYGLNDWGGPAYGSDALAVAMGFANMDRLCTEAPNLIDAVQRKRALSIRDWTRALVATEFAFASAVLGTGPDEWFAINGAPGEHWIGVLERLQGKLPFDPDALVDSPS